MSRSIIIKARCFCCDHVEHPIRINKPTPFSPKGFDVECVKCGSFNSYRVSAEREQIKIETTWIRASQKGIKKYEERTGKNTLQLSPLEQKVWNLVESSGSPRVIDIAKIIFKNTKRKPKSISNSVTSAIRQINLKLAASGANYRVAGDWNGRGGKQISFKKIK